MLPASGGGTSPFETLVYRDAMDNMASNKMAGTRCNFIDEDDPPESCESGVFAASGRKFLRSVWLVGVLVLFFTQVPDDSGQVDSGIT